MLAPPQTEPIAHVSFPPHGSQAMTLGRQLCTATAGGGVAGLLRGAHAHDTPSRPTAASQRLGGITASMHLYIHAADEVYHLDGTLGALGALVARLGTGALDGLLDALGGEDAKHHGDAR